MTVSVLFLEHNNGSCSRTISDTDWSHFCNATAWQCKAGQETRNICTWDKSSMFWGTVNGKEPHTLCCTSPIMAIESSKMQTVPAGSEKSHNISHTCKEFETTRCTEAFHQSCEWMMITRNHLRMVRQQGRSVKFLFLHQTYSILQRRTRDLHSSTSSHISTTIHWRRSAENVCELVPHFNLWELNIELVLVRCELTQHCSPLYTIFFRKKQKQNKNTSHMGITKNFSSTLLDNMLTDLCGWSQNVPVD